MDSYGRLQVALHNLNSGPLTLYCNCFILASTLETISVPSDLCGFVVGKSSVARKGMQIESAGLVDPGFKGQLTLEVINFSREPFILTVGMRIAQIFFGQLDHTADLPYGSPDLNSHYQNQEGPTPARA